MIKRATKLELNKLRDEGRRMELFSLANFGNFNITELRNGIQLNGNWPKLTIPWERFQADGVRGNEEVLKWLINQRDVDMERVAVLTEAEMEDPLIMLFDDVTVPFTTEATEMPPAYIIDGIHRLMGRFRAGKPDFTFYPIQWTMCLEFRDKLMVPDEALLFCDSWGEKDFIDNGLTNVYTGERS